MASVNAGETEGYLSPGKPDDPYGWVRSGRLPPKTSPSLRFKLDAPEVLNLYSLDHCASALLFLSELKRIAVISREYVLLDLTRVRAFSMGALHVVFSLVTAAQLASDSPDIVLMKFPSDSLKKKALDACDFRLAVKPGTASRLAGLCDRRAAFSSGTDASTHLDYIERQIFSCLTRTQRSNVAIRERAIRAMNAISEALLNVEHHAYDPQVGGIQHPAVRGRFWTYLQEKSGRLAFCVHDLGSGIHAGLRNSGFSGDDHSLIAKAMERGVSRTLRSERGKGSEDIKSPIEKPYFSALNDSSTEGPYLFILSGSGRYLQTPASGFEVSGVGGAMAGTFIEWSLPLLDKGA